MRNQQCININPLLAAKPVTLIPHENTDNLSLFLEKELYSLLIALQGVRQHPRYHPEVDALYHSLQVFQLAHKACDDPELWAVALLHDIGKAVNSQKHAQIGADELEGLLSPRIVWLIRHHLHLLKAPRRTRHWLRNTPQLRELERLRAWDLKGRSPHATVITPLKAIDILMKHSKSLLFHSETAYYYENQELG
ncbi:MAG: HD domain-containing protein [Candidatus Parabeggiatoa sp.]|nr:HD domain-containing protein [Candidatus Parabeggiatoa sp.]